MTGWRAIRTGNHSPRRRRYQRWRLQWGARERGPGDGTAACFLGIEQVVSSGPEHASSNRKYPLLIRFAMELCFCAVRAFEVDVHFVAVESQRPSLHFAVPQNSSLHHKGMVVEPAPFHGVDAIARRRPAKQPVKANGPCEPSGGPV